jgi:flagellar biosynthetic protein FliR
METLAERTLGDVPLFLLAFFRVTGMMMVAPVFGSASLPNPVKVFLSLFLAMLLFPQVARSGAVVPSGALAWAGAAAAELGTGLVIGFAAALLFAGVQFGGQIIDQELGLAMANILDPVSNEPVSIVGQFKVLLATVVYLLIDGHHFLVSAVAGSFSSVPVLGLSFGPAAAMHLSDTLLGDLFHMAVQIAAPALVTLFLVTIALAFMARTVPDLNVFALGFSLRLGVGLLVLAVGVGLFVYGFQASSLRHAESVGRLVGLLGG